MHKFLLELNMLMIKIDSVVAVPRSFDEDEGQNKRMNKKIPGINVGVIKGAMSKNIFQQYGRLISRSRILQWRR